MLALRRVAPFLLLLLLASGGAWLVGSAPRGAGPAGSYALLLQGPGGEILFDGSVEVQEATALSVLRAAAGQADLDLEVEGEGGPCGWVYVVAVAGHREAGSAGWEYWVRPAGGAWDLPDHSAACHALRPGDSVLWRWTPSPSAPGEPPQ